MPKTGETESLISFDNQSDLKKACSCAIFSQCNFPLDSIMLLSLSVDAKEYGIISSN